MAITDRDKKILVVLAVLAVMVGYWFLVLQPKRGEVSDLNDKVAAKQSEIDSAKLQVATFTATKATYASDYATVVRLGKAVPVGNDVSSTLVQVDDLMGKKLDFASVEISEYPESLLAPSMKASPDFSPEWPGPSPDGGVGASTPGAGTTPVASGTSGKSSEGGSQPGSSSKEGGSSASEPSGSGGLPFEPLQVSFVFDGNFFKMNRAFKGIHRFVRVSNGQLAVNGRLIFIQGFSFESGRLSYPSISGTLNTIMFSLPDSQGLTMGATSLAPAQGDAQPVSGEGGSESGAANPSATSTPPSP